MAAPAQDQVHRRYERIVQRVVLGELIALVENEAASMAVRETVLGHLSILRKRLDPADATDPAEVGFLMQTVRTLDRVLSGGVQGTRPQRRMNVCPHSR